MTYKNNPFFKKFQPAYIILFIAFLASLLYYQRYTHTFSFVDLSIKVEAARQQVRGRPVYFVTESNNIKVVNGVISSPVLNMLHIPFTWLASCQVKDAFFWMTYGLFFFCIFFAVRLTPLTSAWRPYALACCLIFFFIASRYLFFNFTQGQIYLLFALIVFLLCYLKSTKRYFLFGLVLCLSITIRPLLLTPAILTLFYFNKKEFTGMLAGAVLFLLLTLATHTQNDWKDYFAAMPQYATQLPARMPQTGVVFKVHPIFENNPLDSCTMKVNIKDIFHTPEGRDGGLLSPIQLYLIKDFNTVITSPAFYAGISWGLCLILAFCVRLRFKKISAEKYFAAFFLLYMICEIFIPAPRGPYNYVFWIFGVALILAKGNIAEVACIVVGLLLNHDHPLIRHDREYGELIMLLGCFMFLFRKSQLPYYLQWLQQFKWGKALLQWQYT